MRRLEEESVQRSGRVDYWDDLRGPFWGIRLGRWRGTVSSLRKIGERRESGTC